jgi:lysosomal acid lipase/cholesteryl ester hydrolase
LAVHPKLNDQVNVFIALAPAMSPAGLSNGVVDTLVKASPQVLFLLFGRRSILSSAAMWESLLYPPLFTKLIDLGLSFLFNWRTQNISTSQKLAAYPHLYSFTSTKSVVHWFQIIRTKSFQMYDDDVHPPIITPLSSSTSRRYTKVARYPTRNIKTPIVLVYGGSDSLVDIKAMLKELPSQTVANEVPHYEHLDFLWARDVAEMVFDHVFDALESFTGTEHTKEEYERYRIKRETSSLGTGKGVGIGVGARRGKGLLLELHQQPHGRGHTRGLSSDINDSDVSTAVEGGSNNDEEGDGGAVEGVSAAGPGAETGTVQQQQQQQAAGRGSTASPTPSVLQQQQFRDRHETRIPSPTSGRFGIARPRSARSSLSSLPDEFVGPAAVAAQIQAYTQTHPGQGSGTNPPGQQQHMVTAPPVSPPSSRHGPPAQQKTMRFGEAAAVSVPASRGRSASVGAASTISGGSDFAVAVGAGASVGVGAGHGGSGGSLTTPHSTAVTPPPQRRGTAGGSQIALSESLRGGRGISLGASTF